MSYTKTTWTNGATALSAANMNNIETGVETVDLALAAHILLTAIYGTTSGSANTYTMSPSPAIAGYTEGMVIYVKINASNTGASTINLNSKGAKAIKQANGAALTANCLKSGSAYTLIYNGTNFYLPCEAADLVSTHDSAATPHAGKFEVANAVSDHNALATAHMGTVQRAGCTAVKTAAYNIAVTDFMVRCGGTEDYDVVLPSAVSCSGQMFVIQRVVGGTNVIGVATTSSQTINGAAAPLDFSTAQWQTYYFVSDGANWCKL